MTGPETADLTALGVRVGAVERDIGEVNDRLLGLDTKIDKAVTGLASEFRSQFSALTSQLSERNRTPWAVLISAAGFIVAILGVFGSQALSPLQSDIRLLKEQLVPRSESEHHYDSLRSDVKSLREQIVPRDEINYRAEVTNRRFSTLEDMARLLADRRYGEMQKQIERLEYDNRELRRSSH